MACPGPRPSLRPGTVWCPSYFSVKAHITNFEVFSYSDRKTFTSTTTKKTGRLSPNHSPLEAFLLLTLLADLGELPLVVLSRTAVLGFAAWVVFHAFHLLFPSLHQLVIPLADVLFLLSTTSTRH